MNLTPRTRLGKWSVLLNVFFLIAITTSIVLVNGLGVLSYDDHWWDVTVPLTFFAGTLAFIFGIIAIRKKKESSALVYFSVVIGWLTILFALLHSAFISD